MVKRLRQAVEQVLSKFLFIVELGLMLDILNLTIR